MLVGFFSPANFPFSLERCNVIFVSNIISAWKKRDKNSFNEEKIPY